ncbi:hypothetical protein ACI01nite_07220 [Acetobacter cibinongensis]|uniref:Uncharacterized protein n=1 Tax=Acetobacter cibinongensis TaxID=146475 RepID=A0A0D6N4H8_9PROT|nr:hypothetical protein Abci_011_146 [Acetobacter cibinongensis]GBQ18604.1 hypothetical protein AA0482_2296 [Acetobacter cibinongensis NRIC 0482]GEL58120.1 hypothetical protein ACI01nite_07220 [Acetobacter cibinongensis]
MEGTRFLGAPPLPSASEHERQEKSPVKQKFLPPPGRAEEENVPWFSEDQKAEK